MISIFGTGGCDEHTTQIPAEHFATPAFKDGDAVVLTPRKARVFVA